MQELSDTLSIDIFFFHQGEPRKLDVPVKRISDQRTGLTHFEFETTVQGLPQIDKNDPRYSDLFFAFRVTDQVGNQYYQKESYAQFMAPGEKGFGVNNMADFKVEQLIDDVSGQTKTIVLVTPKQEPNL